MTHHAISDLKGLARQAKRKCANNQNMQIGIYGPTGSGKTAVALLLAKEINDDLDVQVQVVFSSAAREAAIRRIPRGRVIIEDEAMLTGGNRRRAMSRDNVEAQNSLVKGRKMGHVRIRIMPFMDDDDSAQFKHMHYVFKLHSEENPGLGDVYEVFKRGLKKTSIWLEHRWPFKYPFFGDLHPDLWNEYDERVKNWLRGGELDDADQIIREERVALFRQIVREEAVAGRILASSSQ